LVKTEDSELGTYALAQVTVHTFIGMHDFRRMIALLIELGRQDENTPRAELHTKTATLTPVLDYVYSTLR
jgi:hypothetical protein